ncbi:MULTISPECIES: PhzF family phenazine biosynthesis protein [unclassified Brucella]|uniref:PhzF family phenazine biosynthesis protein n=1 Tax=unclassified Brucella TaxID=2632610 RepID=UPI00217DD18A|nr:MULTISPECIES: PhzF family phenazine biosynthesis protein [unclassified Brucella]UWF65901.1 PhzF family phenazine biosynthesis protein [Brucella sp. 1315]UWF69022.1 PhzF family phenazine biosynthesis protein [Brucella sp. 2594]
MKEAAVSGRFYEVFDVFADKALAGNPLAIVHECDGLTDACMQAIAREFNLSETVFIHAPANPAHEASVRIFTPAYELPFAGHPTVGAAVSLARRQKTGDETDRLVTLEEKVGIVRCGVILGENSAFAEFDLPRLPEQVDVKIEREEAAAAIGLGTHEIGFENHVPGVWSAGTPCLLVPVHNLIAAAKVSIDPVYVSESLPHVGGRPLPIYVYCRETILFDSHFHARMFVIGANVYEDPATGSAVAAFAGMIQQNDKPVDGSSQWWIEQGMEMGRPSRIRLELDVSKQKLVSARIGGTAVKIAEGRLFV